jgi:hypothetical protein
VAGIRSFVYGPTMHQGCQHQVADTGSAKARGMALRGRNPTFRAVPPLSTTKPDPRTNARHRCSWLGYVLGDPINPHDPLGLMVKNYSDQPVLVKPEDNSKPIGVLPPHQEWPGSPDGVYRLPDGPWTKTPGKSYLPDNEVLVRPDGSVQYTGGYCYWNGWEKLPKPPDPSWPQEPEPLPHCRPVQPTACPGGA